MRLELVKLGMAKSWGYSLIVQLYNNHRFAIKKKTLGCRTELVALSDQAIGKRLGSGYKQCTSK